ncbi:hypothetical protein Tco_0721331 [Tanacetum coccineum]
MSTSKTYQQSLADAGSETKPPMLERGSYIPWASRFRRYINRKRENRKWLNKALDEGPYQFKMFIPNNLTVPKLQTAEDLQGDALLHYDTEMELMNLILLSITNDIYNSVDACTSAKDMWKRVERLMRGSYEGNYTKQIGLAKRLTVEEIVEGSNAPNETGNVQRTLRTSLQEILQLMEEIEELSANICLMARIQPADNTYDVGPSYDSAFINTEDTLLDAPQVQTKKLPQKSEMSPITNDRDSTVKNSVLANSKKPAKKVAVCVRKNKQTDNTSENVISNKENVIDVDVANASKAKTLLCVSCMQNVLIPCHANCFANYKLNVHSNVRRTLSTKSRIPKSYDTTYVVHKTRFSKESTLSKSLETTYVVSKPEIDVGSTSKANDKVVQIVLWIVDSGCSKHMTGDRSLLKNSIEKFMVTVRFRNA